MPDLEAIEVAQADLSDVNDGESSEAPKKAKQTEQPELEAEDDAADAGEGEDEGEGEAGKESKSQRRRRMRREREQEVTRKVSALQAENAKLKERAKQGGREPDARYYQSDAEYAADLAVYRSRQADVQAEERRISEEYGVATNDDAESFKTAAADLVAEGREKFADYDAVVSRKVEEGGPPITTIMVEAMIETDFGADIAYYLGKNVKEAARISNLSPVAQARAIFELEKKVSAKTPPPKSQAPAPVKPVRGGSSAPIKPVSEMSMSEYAAYRQKQMQGDR